MFKKSLIILICAVLAAGLCACTVAEDPSGSSEVASSEPASSEPQGITLTEQAEAALNNYYYALTTRTSYQSCVVTRLTAFKGDAQETVLSYYTPVGPGYFDYRMKSYKNEELILDVDYGGRSGTTVFNVGNAEIMAATHVRMKMTADFEFKDLTITEMEYSDDGNGTYIVTVTYAGATTGRLLSELGGGKAENIIVTAVTDDNDTLLSEDILFDYIPVSGEKSVFHSVTTLSRVEDLTSAEEGLK